MKYRFSLISNSSSSSFIILGNELSFQKDWLKKCENIWCVGEYICEGLDVFELTPEIAQVIWNDRIDVVLSYYKASKVIYEESEELINKGELPEQFQVFAFEKDYHGTQNLKSFKEKYVRKNKKRKEIKCE